MGYAIAEAARDGAARRSRWCPGRYSWRVRTGVAHVGVESVPKLHDAVLFRARRARDIRDLQAGRAPADFTPEKLVSRHKIKKTGEGMRARA